MGWLNITQASTPTTPSPIRSRVQRPSQRPSQQHRASRANTWRRTAAAVRHVCHMAGSVRAPNSFFSITAAPIPPIRSLTSTTDPPSSLLRPPRRVYERTRSVGMLCL